MDEQSERSGSESQGRWRVFRESLRRRWLLVVTLMTLAVSGATIILISGSGLASGCGGFSGSSGGGNCEADLSVRQTVSASPAHVGERLFYLIIVTNKGPDTAQYVRLVVRMPLNSRAEWALSSQGECTRLDKTKVADCIVAYQLRPGQRAAVSLVVVPNSTKTLSSRAGVSSETDDPNKGNNVVTLRTPVKP